MSTAAPLRDTAAQSPLVSNSFHAGLLLQRKCACGGSASSSLSGECEECNKKRLQKKISIGASNDPLEQEADRVAEQVLANPAHSAVSGATPGIPQLTGQAAGDGGIAVPSANRPFTGSGRPNDPATQGELGKRFVHDFSQMRLHTGATVGHSARDENALAHSDENRGLSHFSVPSISSVSSNTQLQMQEETEFDAEEESMGSNSEVSPRNTILNQYLKRI